MTALVVSVPMPLPPTDNLFALLVGIARDDLDPYAKDGRALDRLHEARIAPVTRVTGDHMTRLAPEPFVVFQSTPVSGVTGDKMPPRGKNGRFKFQSTPVTRVTGDIDYALDSNATVEFQSTPVTGITGDV